MTFDELQRPGRWALVLLVIYCLGVFSVPMVTDRGLTIHEAVLPQSTRGMYLADDWLIPRFGTAPWLENPPLPQWTTLALCTVVGHCDGIWMARLGAVVAGTILAVTTMLLAARLFGSLVGVVSGFTMASSYLVVRYASLAEDEIYLAMLVALALYTFVRIEFDKPGIRGAADITGVLLGFIRNRPKQVWLLFILLGATNLTKGVIFGPVMALIPIGIYLLATVDIQRIATYIWLPGWLVFAIIGLTWPILAWQQHPGALELWGFDLFGRLDGSYVEINQPWWYYLKAIPEASAPWILVIPVGLWCTWHKAWQDRFSAERFLWVWALAFPLVLSIPGGKHQHYLLHGIVPWAILAAIGVLYLGEKLTRVNRRYVAVGLFTLIAALFIGGQLWRKGTHHDDAVMLREAAQLIPADATVLADLDVVGLRGFHSMMYLPVRTLPLHNLSFLHGDNIPGDEAYLVTRYSKRHQMGVAVDNAEVVLQSVRSDRSTAKEGLLTLFLVKLDPDRQTFPVAPVYISPMQAMYRTPGPYLGDEQVN